MQMKEKRMSVLSFISMLDNGGRRLKTDRRKKTLPLGFPDRRSGRDRRAGRDRREQQADKSGKVEERRRTAISSPFDL